MAVSMIILLATTVALSVIKWISVSTLLGALVGTAVATLGYATVFIWAGLSSNRGLIYSIVYLLVWESLLVNLIGGLKYTSISSLAVGISGAIDETNLSNANSSLDMGIIPGAIGIAVFVVGFYLWSVRKLSTMDIP